jgi:hypothetical protein
LFQGLIVEIMVGCAIAPYLTAIDVLVQTSPRYYMKGRVIGLKVGLDGISSVAGKFVTGKLISLVGVVATTSLEPAAVIVFVSIISIFFKRRGRRSHS